MPISASGIGSGLDIESLVSQLVAAEGQPAANRINTKEARLQADLSAYGSLKSALSSFQSSLKSLNDPADFLSRTTKSSNTELFGATANTSAVAGNYSIEITQLAQAAKMRSGDFAEATDDVGTGTLDISLGADSFQITIDDSNKTLEGIRDAINTASDNSGVTASIINVDGGSRLILSTDKVGATNTIAITAVDDDAGDGADLTRLATANLVSVQDAQDSIMLVDGQTVTRDSNSFSDVIQGVTLTLEKAEPGTVETLSVELDKASVTSNVDRFVTAYNSLADTVSSLSSYDADTGAAGTLLGDSALRGVQSQIRQMMSSAINGLDVNSLVSLGITTNDDGHLEVDSDKLNQVMTDDFTAVSQFFASENGLANSLDNLLERYINTDNGILTARSDGLQSSIDSLDEDRTNLDRRLAALDKRYRAQFIAMDVLVSQLRTLGDYMTQQLASLPEPNSIRR